MFCTGRRPLGVGPLSRSCSQQGNPIYPGTRARRIPGRGTLRQPPGGAESPGQSAREDSDSTLGVNSDAERFGYPRSLREVHLSPAPRIAGLIRERNFCTNSERQRISPSVFFRPSKFACSIFCGSAFIGCLLKNKEERLNHEPQNTEHANAEVKATPPPNPPASCPKFQVRKSRSAEGLTAHCIGGSREAGATRPYVSLAGTGGIGADPERVEAAPLQIKAESNRLSR